MRKSEFISARGLDYSDSQETKISIDDLEVNLSLNKMMLKDALKLIKTLSKNPDSDSTVPSSILSSLEAENSHIENSIFHMMSQISQGEEILEQVEERKQASRIRKKQSLKKSSSELSSLKEQILKKEEEIRSLEKYAQGLDEVLTESHKNSLRNPYEILNEETNLLEKTTDDLEFAKASNAAQVQKCLRLEKVLSLVQKSTKISMPSFLQTTDAIIHKKYCIDFDDIGNLLESQRIDSEFIPGSSIESLTDVKLIEEYRSNHITPQKVPLLKLPAESLSKSVPSDVCQLEIILQMLSSEFSSLTKVLDNLRSYESTLYLDTTT